MARRAAWLGAALAALGPSAAPGTLPALVRGWGSGLSQGAWCGEACLLANAQKLLTANMSLEVDPFMQITDSIWPTVTAEGWWEPPGGIEVAIDAHGRAAPRASGPGAFPSSARAAGGRGLAPIGAALHGLRGANNAGGLRFGVDLVLAVPRAAVSSRSPVLGAPDATAATIANLSDSVGQHHFGLNASAPGTAEYAQSLAQLLLSWRVDHVAIVGGAMAERWLPAVRAFVVAFNRTRTNGRTLAIASHQPNARVAPGSALMGALRRLADSVAAGPPLWDTWSHLLAALRRAEAEWRLPLVCGEQLCARWDIGALPIGRLGAVRNGSQSYPPWSHGSCTDEQLGCGDAAAATQDPACCPRQSRLSPAESRLVYALALATNSPLVLGGSLLGLSNSMPSMRRFTLPDRGAFAYSRSPLVGRATVLPVPADAVVACRGTSSTTQPRMYDYEWMCFVFNTADAPLNLTLDLSVLPLDSSAPGNATGRDYMLDSLLGTGGPVGAYFSGQPLRIGGSNSSLAPVLPGHDAFALRVSRVRVGDAPRPRKNDDTTGHADAIPEPPPVRRLAWSDMKAMGSSITALMAASTPVVLTGSPVEAWAQGHWSPGELRTRLDMLLNVRWSNASSSFTYFAGKEWSALFGSPMERAAARMASDGAGALDPWAVGARRGAERRPGIRPESARPHQVASILPAEEFFAHADSASPPYYYASGALDEKVVVAEGGEPLLPELSEGLLPALEPYPHHDLRPHIWLGQPGVSVTLHYDTNDNT